MYTWQVQGAEREISSGQLDKIWQPQVPTLHLVSWQRLTGAIRGLEEVQIEWPR